MPKSTNCSTEDKQEEDSSLQNCKDDVNDAVYYRQISFSSSFSDTNSVFCDSKTEMY